MKKFTAIAKTTVLEVLSEPLSLLLLLSALALAILAPALHCHQFGEATRMARDAGLSALFLFGTALAAFSTVRAFRREIEQHSDEMVLAHAVSPPVYFLGKSCGCFGAALVFDLIVFLVSLCLVHGAAIGGAIAAKAGTLPRLWGPSLALGVSVLLLPLVLSAILNRFARWRFVPTVFSLSLLLALGAMAYQLDVFLLERLLSAFLPLVFLQTLILFAAAAFSVRLAAGLALTLIGMLTLALLPFLGNYYQAEALARGGHVPMSYVLSLLAATLPAVVAFAALGLSWTAGETQFRNI